MHKPRHEITCSAKSYLKIKNKDFLTHGSQTIMEAPNTHKGKCLLEEVIYGMRHEPNRKIGVAINMIKSLSSRARWDLRHLVQSDFLD